MHRMCSGNQGVIGGRFQPRHSAALDKFLRSAPLLIVTLILALSIAGCSRSTTSTAETPAQTRPYSVAVFVPGVIAGSPTYEMLAAGARRAVEEHPGAVINIIEGGTNQGEWENSVASIAAAGAHDLIITSNPAMPAICDAVSKKFPKQHFIVLDGTWEGNPMIYTLRYDQYEQAFIAGYLAGLVTAGPMDGANDQLKVGLIAGQEYPDMTGSILPGFSDGAKAASPGAQVDFRVVGNWYDASKGAELARSMISGGVDVILPISGGANQGVVTAARETGTYIIWFDQNGYAIEPGVVVGSTAIKQDLAAYERVTAAIEGTLEVGTSEVVGLAEGWIVFIDDDPLYRQYVPQTIRDAQRAMLESRK